CIICPGVMYSGSLYRFRVRTAACAERLPSCLPEISGRSPTVAKEDIGGRPVMGRYPYLVNPGPRAYLIVNVGETEKAQINQEESDLLKEVCAYRSDFCMDGVSAKGQAH